MCDRWWRSDCRLYDPLPTMTRADDRCNNVINLAWSGHGTHFEISAITSSRFRIRFNSSQFVTADRYDDQFQYTSTYYCVFVDDHDDYWTITTRKVAYPVCYDYPAWHISGRLLQTKANITADRLRNVDHHQFQYTSTYITVYSQTIEMKRMLCYHSWT